MPPVQTNTTTYNFNTPVEGGDDDIWGGELNDNWVSADSILTAMQAKLDELEAEIDENKLAAQIPIDGLYFSGADLDPATTLGYGTWEAVAAGRAIVGVGNNGESDWAIGEERGSETHTLTTAQMPNHTHKVDPPNTNTNTTGSHTHTYNTFGGDGSSGEPGGDGSARTKSTNSAGSHSHSVNIPEFNSGSQGGGGSHNNVQPSLGVYVYRRLA